MEASLSQLTFGVEFEVVVPGHLTRQAAAAEVSRLIGKPVDPSYPATGRNWKIVSDGSVRGQGAGLEFVSPVLSGQSGLDEVAAVANALRQIGATVNQSCGYHVHVGARGSRLDFFKNLVKLYARYEEAIDSIMPPSRRGNRADYCKSVARVTHTSIDRATSVEQISREVYRSSGAHAPRYHKLNLDAFQKHSTVEFRQHSGTVEASKAVNWVLTCLKLVKAAQDGKTGAGPRIANDYSAFALKTRVVAEMISRPEGATLAEICARGNWGRMGIKRHAALAGFAFRKRGERYFMIEQSADASVAPVPATLDGLAALIEATPEQKEFFAARRAAVSSTN